MKKKIVQIDLNEDEIKLLIASMEETTEGDAVDGDGVGIWEDEHELSEATRLTNKLQSVLRLHRYNNT